MKANELLFWLSARRQGSWQQFRAAVEELHSTENDFSSNVVAPTNEDEFPLHQQLRVNFERLAHVEFFAQDCEEGWRIAPPTFAVHAIVNGMRAVLCGARSPLLRERVLRFGEKVNPEILHLDGIPEVIRLTNQEPSTLAEIATQVGVYFQLDAPFALLSSLLPCDPPLRLQSQSEFPHGAEWIIHEFDTTNLKWRKIERRQAEIVRIGLIRFRIYFQRPRYFLRWKGMTLEMSRAEAIYVLMRYNRQNVLKYNREAAELSIPAICRPPRLLERALVLCSGLPPNYDTSTARLTYTDVPIDIAHFSAELLRQSVA